MSDLRKIAEAATPKGRWYRNEESLLAAHEPPPVDLNRPEDWTDHDNLAFGDWLDADAEFVSHGDMHSQAAAEFIATFDPPTVLALLDVAEAAEQVDAECGVTHAALEGALDKWRDGGAA